MKDVKINKREIEMKWDKVLKEEEKTPVKLPAKKRNESEKVRRGETEISKGEGDVRLHEEIG